MYRYFVDSREGFDAMTREEYNDYLDYMEEEKVLARQEEELRQEEEDDDDHQPTMYEEYQDLYGGDDYDHGQFDEW